MSDVTIYHNPKCGTSRNTLEMIRNAGIEPEVILYLETPPSRETLVKLIADMGISVRETLRPKWTDDQLLDFMMQHPILINRPIVVTELGTKLCRPSELVLDILPAAQKGAFTKEDGEKVVDADGKRLI